MALSLVKLFRRAFRLVLLCGALVAGAIAVDSVVRPMSTLMLARMMTGQPVDRRWVPLEAVAPRLVTSVILSEDGQYCRHRGVDWGAMRDVLRRRGSPSRGASTLTMQVVKNLFLWPGRSYIRKAVEIPLALVLDALWGKKRVIEVYLNVAEWGEGGVFGIEAAARRDFGKSASALSPREAALLATALPNPFLREPNHPSPMHRRLAARVLELASEPGSHTACLR